MMKYKTFITLYGEAKEYTDAEMYVAERGWQDWMDEYSKTDDTGVLNAEVLTDWLFAIHELANANWIEKRKKMGISRAEMSRTYDIPIRTLEDWEAEKNKPTVYTEALISYTILMDKMRCAK